MSENRIIILQKQIPEKTSSSNKPGNIVLSAEFNKPISIIEIHSHSASTTINCDETPLPAFKNGLYGYIDKFQHVCIDYQFDYAFRFINNLARVEKDNKINYIDLKGNCITEWYDDISTFENGFARVRNASKYTYINLKGKPVCDWYDDIYSFYNGIAKVKLNNQYAFINQSFILVSNWYDDVYGFNNESAKAKRNNTWLKIINDNGKIKEIINTKPE